MYKVVTKSLNISFVYLEYEKLFFGIFGKLTGLQLFNEGYAINR